MAPRCSTIGVHADGLVGCVGTWEKTTPAAPRQEEGKKPLNKWGLHATIGYITLFCQTKSRFVVKHILGFSRVMSHGIKVFRNGIKVWWVVFFGGWDIYCLCCLRLVSKKLGRKAPKPQISGYMVAHRVFVKCEMLNDPRGFFCLETGNFRIWKPHTSKKASGGYVFFWCPILLLLQTSMLKGKFENFPIGFKRPITTSQRQRCCYVEVTLVLAHRWSRSLRVWRSAGTGG